MNTFLEDIASEIISNHTDTLHKIQIVLPSKRGALFLKNAFKKEVPTCKRFTLSFGDQAKVRQIKYSDYF